MSPFTEILRETTVHVIGRCPVKGCTTARKRCTAPGTVKAGRIRTWTEWRIPAGDGYGTVNPYAHVNYLGWTPNRFAADQRYERAYVAAMRAVGWVCETHQRFFELAEVKGVFNADKTCNARCTNAVGADCECSCAGQQHGAAHI